MKKLPLSHYFYISVPGMILGSILIDNNAQSDLGIVLLFLSVVMFLIWIIRGIAWVFRQHATEGSTEKPKQNPATSWIIIGLFIITVTVIALNADSYDTSPYATLVPSSVLTRLNDKRAEVNLSIVNMNDTMQEIAQGLAEDIQKNGCDSLNLKDKKSNGTIKQHWGYLIECNASDTNTFIDSILQSPSNKQILLNESTAHYGIGTSGESVVILMSADPYEKE